MNNLYFILYIFLFAVVANTNSQINIRGIILDNDNNPLPYASVGISKQNIGTYSYENGSFELVIPENLVSENVNVSHIGYKTLVVPITQLIDKTNKIYLEKKTQQLDEIVIRSFKKEDITHLGSNKSSSSSDISIENPVKGSEVAVLINTESKVFLLKQISIAVKSQNIESFKLRVNIYNTDPINNNPLKLINDFEIIESFKVKEGFIEFNLEKPVQLKDRFFIAFEWLVPKKKSEKIDTIKKEIDEYILDNYTSSKCQRCSKVIYNNKTVVFFNEKGLTLDKTSLSKEDKKRLKILDNKKPKLSFKTSKENFPTFYRYTSFGEWYKYPQSLIVKIKGYSI